jgi:hypothetical protein
MISWPSSVRWSRPASPPLPRRQPGRSAIREMVPLETWASYIWRYALRCRRWPNRGHTTTTRPHQCSTITVSARLRSRLEAASGSCGTSMATSPESVNTILARFPVKGVAPVPTDRIVPVISRMLSHLLLQGGFQHRLDQRFQQPARTGQRHSLGAGPPN